MDTMIVAKLFWQAHRFRDRETPLKVVYGSHGVSSIKTLKRKVIISVSEVNTMDVPHFLKILERKNPSHKVFIRHNDKTYKLKGTELRGHAFHLVHEVAE